MRLLIGITGGIAAYKIPALVRLFTKRSVEVKTVVTPSALGFVGLEALRTVTGFPVYRDLTPTEQNSLELYTENLAHIKLAEWADAMLIAPASANTIAKISRGIGDNLLTTTALSFTGSNLIVAPAMNTEMWNNPVTRENCAACAERGITMLPVDEGELACGTTGAGRMLDIEILVTATIEAVSRTRPLYGKKVLISSGPTVEAIDPVRVLTNRSSGRMGASLAQAALDNGAEVTVIAGPSLVTYPTGCTVISVQSAREMHAALSNHFDATDICIMAAAVADFTVEHPAVEKIARKKTDTPVTLTLIPNPDILAALGKRKQKQFVIGFSLETNGDIERAREKMNRKKCDIMVFNRASEALEKSTTRITLLMPDGTLQKAPLQSKDEAARLIIATACARMR